MSAEHQPEIALIVDVLADHIWRAKKHGPAECWSANDTECGLRFTTGGEYRRHVAGLIADRLADERDDVKIANTAVWVMADRASRKGYELDPEDVLHALREAGRG